MRFLIQIFSFDVTIHAIEILLSLNLRISKFNYEILLIKACLYLLLNGWRTQSLLLHVKWSTVICIVAFIPTNVIQDVVLILVLVFQVKWVRLFQISLIHHLVLMMMKRFRLKVFAILITPSQVKYCSSFILMRVILFIFLVFVELKIPLASFVGRFVEIIPTGVQNRVAKCRIRNISYCFILGMMCNWASYSFNAT